MTEHEEKTSVSHEVKFIDGLERYQEKQALQRMLYYASEEAARLGYADCDKQILIAVAILEKEHNSALS